MKAEDVVKTLGLALEKSACDQAKVQHKPKFLSDNGRSYSASDLADYLEDKGMDHVLGHPASPSNRR